MANKNYYQWKASDSLWTVAGRYWSSSGYSNVITFAEAIRLANRTILNWTALPLGTQIYLPIISFS